MALERDLSWQWQWLLACLQKGSTAWRGGWVFSADLELMDMMNNVP